MLDIKGAHEVIAAPTLQEVLTELPVQIDGIYDLVLSPLSGGRWVIAFCEPDCETQYHTVADTPTGAATHLYLTLREKGLL